jgi:regulator of sirC expression with transglutaminase-like and TPR domain
MTTRSRKTFEELITLPDLGIPIAEAALLLACEEYPQLSLAPYLEQLDDIAGDIDNRLKGHRSTLDTIATINEVLFDEYGFHGNSSAYYDPRNSFLNDVLDRRTGIPITLSAIYMEVAQRIGFHIDGVGIPGHFIVKHVSRTEETFLDPFNAGAVMTEADCRDLIRQMNGDDDPDEEHWLRRVTHRQIVARMLNNLKVIYVNGGAFDKALIMLELMVLTDSSDPTLYKQRGMLHLQLRQFGQAARDLDQYLKICPDAPDHEEIDDYLKDIRRIRAMMN